MRLRNNHFGCYYCRHFILCVCRQWTREKSREREREIKITAPANTIEARTTWSHLCDAYDSPENYLLTSSAFFLLFLHRLTEGVRRSVVCSNFPAVERQTTNETPWCEQKIKQWGKGNDTLPQRRKQCVRVNTQHPCCIYILFIFCGLFSAFFSLCMPMERCRVGESECVRQFLFSLLCGCTTNYEIR